LRGKDFSHADLRGFDLSEAILAGANFNNTRSGIRPLSKAGLLLVVLAVAAVSGLVIGYSSSLGPLVANLPAEDFTMLQQRVLPWIAVILFGFLMLTIMRQGLGAVLGTFALAVAFLTALVAILFRSAGVAATALIMMLATGAGVAGMITLAASEALLLELVGAHAIWTALFVAIAGTIPGIAEGVFDGITQPDRTFRDAPPASLLITGTLVAVILTTSVYIGRRAMAGDRRYNLLWVLTIGILTRMGTSFRGANLADADFTGALLGNTDLRSATLLHTNFTQAAKLNRARTEGTYLAHPSVAQLVTSRSAPKGKFDHLDLQGINLDGADLTGASFIGAALGRATMRAANLAHAKLVHAQLHDADLTGACLTGANIEDWGISTKTRLDDIRCEYVYTRLPTDLDPDPWRKPDNKLESFQEGDFSDFIAPIVKTMSLYRQQEIDPRAIGRAYKTLDLFHHDAIDPMASAIALARLGQRHPSASLELVALEGRGQGKIRVQATVAPEADRSALSAEYDAIYDEIRLLPQPRLAALLAEITEKDSRIRSLEDMVATSLKTEKFYIETYIDLGGPSMTSVKCLFLAANPAGMPRLSLDREIREITAKIRSSEYRDALQLVSEWAVRPDDLLQVLNVHKPQIVHFSGHGTAAGEIVLVDDNGIPKPVSVAAIRALFTTLKDNLRLVILNACYAETQARAITEVIDCAIGMDEAISDEAAITFIASFYRALGFGRSIQEAFDQGVTALMLAGIPNVSTPRLLMRAGVHPESIVLVRPVPWPEAKQPT
jgi:uncharacterized protein YjbI with pentapeptide repeats